MRVRKHMHFSLLLYYMAQPQHCSTAIVIGYPDMLECGNLNGPLAAVESRTHFGAPVTSLHIILVLASWP
eukprot:COSAG02_NODE_893_length_16140_cov_19.677621_16_plen_70_part_00